MLTDQRRALPKQGLPGTFVHGLGLLYAFAAFLLALSAFLYAIPFLANFRTAGAPLVSPTIDVGRAAAAQWAAAVDLGLVMLFGLQHSLMAREGFKRRLRRRFPAGLERATYVLASSLTFWPVLLLWQPIPFVLVDFSGVRIVLTTAYLAGWLIVLTGALNNDLLELWGVRQAWAWSRGKTHASQPFKERWLYGRVRHPIYLGLFIAFWATPVLTAGHALFAAAMTAYILIGARFEERDLVRKHGRPYRDYQRTVPAFLPRLRSRAN